MSSEYDVARIPGWKKLPWLPSFNSEAESRDHRFSDKSDPLLVFQTLVVTLWFDLGVRERSQRFAWSTPQATFSRVLRSWTTPKGNHTLSDVWREYMAALTPGQRQRWRKKLQEQAGSWSDWDEASRLAGRVHSPWFRIIMRARCTELTGCLTIV